MNVKTARIEGRRELHFENVDDILIDAESILGSPHRSIGNWSTAQVVEHIALAFERSVDGSDYRPPFFVRWIAILLKRRILYGPMRSGFKMPTRMRQDFYPDASIDEATALANLRDAIGRFKLARSLAPNVALGDLSRQEWEKLHMRHAEMHLSFLVEANDER